MSDQVMVDVGKFANNEKVFVPHTDKYYEAKILKTEYRGQSGWFYFLHYNGWNKKYDEWVEEGGIVKAEVAEAAGAGMPAPSKTKKASGTPHAGPSFLAAGASIPPTAVAMARGGGSGGARGGGGPSAAALPPLGGPAAAATAVAPPPPPVPSIGLDIELPPLLKKYLIDDFENVFEENRFVPLPRDPCISDLMERYVKEAKELRTGTVDAEEEVSAGLQSYFDKTLLPMLLYRNERGQAGYTLADGRCPSAVYGAEHLLRLIYKLPEILPLTTLSDDHLSTLATMVQDVITWLADNHATVFLSKNAYLPPEPPAAAAVAHTGDSGANVPRSAQLA